MQQNVCVDTVIARSFVKMIQYQHWCACVAFSVSTYTKRNTLPRLWSLKHGPVVDLKCSCCSLATCRIHFFKKKLNHRNHFSWAITAKRLRLPAIGRTSSAHTLVTTTQAISPCSFHRAPLQLSSVSVSATCRTAPTT